MVRRLFLVAALLLSGAAAPAPPPTLPGAASYADLVILTLAAPVIVRATLLRADRIAPEQAAGVGADNVRVLATAALTTAIVAPGEVPATIDYLADVAPAARGKPPRLKGTDVLLFLRPGVSGYALANARGQIGWSATAEASVRRIIAEARSGSAPVITGINNAFRVGGSVPGEAESQFFLATADGKPVSLVVLSRPGEPRRLSVALGDVIDEAAAGVKPETLLWYRLACFLPRTLPAEAVADAELGADYAFVLKALGPCGRTLP